MSCSLLNNIITINRPNKHNITKDESSLVLNLELSSELVKAAVR